MMSSAVLVGYCDTSEEFLLALHILYYFDLILTQFTVFVSLAEQQQGRFRARDNNEERLSGGRFQEITCCITCFWLK